MSNINNNTNYTLSDIARITDVNPFATIGSNKPGSIAGRKIHAIDNGIKGVMAAVAVAVFAVFSGCALMYGGFYKLGALFIVGGATTVVGSPAIAGALHYNGYIKKLSKEEVMHLIGEGGGMALAETNNLIEQYAIHCQRKADKLTSRAKNANSSVSKAIWEGEAASWIEKKKLTESQKISYANIIKALVTDVAPAAQEVPYPIFTASP